MFKVLQNTITKEEIEKVLEYYNNNKDADENPLQRLDRVEGGFQIDIPKEKWVKNYYCGGFTDANNKIRQLRWNKGQLSSMGYIGFTSKQYTLLCDALVNSLPPGSVVLEN